MAEAYRTDAVALPSTSCTVRSVTMNPKSMDASAGTRQSVNVTMPQGAPNPILGIGLTLTPGCPRST